MISITKAVGRPLSVRVECFAGIAVIRMSTLFLIGLASFFGSLAANYVPQI